MVFYIDFKGDKGGILPILQVLTWFWNGVFIKFFSRMGMTCFFSAFRVSEY